MSELANPTACLIIIGNEILSGRTVDANLPFLAQELGGIGVVMREVRVVPDDEAEIVGAVNALRARYTYVFTTGGIGPTHDDITAACIARAFGLPFGRNPEAERRLRAYYPPEKLNDARLKMAETPEGAELIDNPVSVAPGFRVENVYVLPGVPKIMQAMFAGLKAGLKGGAASARARSSSSARRARSPSRWGASRPITRASRSAATRTCASSGSAPASSFAAPTEQAITAAVDELLALAQRRGIKAEEAPGI